MFMNKLLLLPVFAHVLLVLGLVRLVGKARVAAVTSGAVKLADVAVDGSRWPEDCRKFANAYQNQFEQPVLFYTVTLLFIALNLADYTALALSAIYVALRYAHAYIHVGSNNVPKRFRVFAASMGTLAVLWVWFGYRLVLA